MEISKSGKLSFFKISRLILIWIIIFTSGVAISRLMFLFYSVPESVKELYFNFPPINLVLLFVIINIFSKPEIGALDDYLFGEYPDVWKKVHPFGRFSCFSLATRDFLNNKYEDNTNPKIIELKKLIRLREKLFLLAFFSSVFLMFIVML